MKYRNRLPQQDGKLCLTDGGLETVLIFLDGIDLPGFSSISMVSTQEKRDHLEKYFRQHLDLAIENKAGFILESPTWRSSHGWAEEIEQTPAEMDELNKKAINFLLSIQEKYEVKDTPIVVNGSVGPRGDGYVVTDAMSVEEAREYHAQQIGVLAEAGADCISALTLNYVEEAAGIVLAAQDKNVPVTISFTVETDGKLITGQTLGEAIKAVDEITNSGPVYYMVNCAHPTHFESALDDLGSLAERVGGVRANASRCSHEELDNAEELDIGNPDELGREYLQLTTKFPQLKVLGGCCGTDIRHIEAIARYQFEQPISAVG